MTLAADRAVPRGSRPSLRRRLAAALSSVALAALLGVVPAQPFAGTASADLGPSGLVTGFVDETLASGLFNPTAIAFAPDGRVFVTEKRGLVKTWPSIAALEANAVPTTTLDLRVDVMNYWDRGLLGLAVDPGWPTKADIYLLYSADAPPGEDPPYWNTGDPNNDQCPSPPGGNTDGCTITNRLERVRVNATTGVASTRTLLLSGWCQQFPSHSAGSLLFGPDGMLYASGGEGASFNTGAQDYGQKGGTQPAGGPYPTPKNPCGDPPGGVAGTMTAPTAEGGALRAQSFRRSSDESAVLNGTVLRLDPDTGAAATGNPAIGNSDPIRRRIVAYGLRNPFRMVFRPGTSDLYVGDVGYSTWEEVNRISNPTNGPTNFGWPCHEGPQTGTYYTTVSLTLCSTLDAGTVTPPLYDYPQTGHMATNDGCPPISPATSASASISGLAFGTSSSYPAPYRNALFVADYSRNCIVALPAGGSGVPTGSAIPFDQSAGAPVMLTTDPDGDLIYADFSGGKVHRIRYQPPTASFSATPSSGMAPLDVDFDASASSAPAGIDAYDWDFGDGTAHGSGKTVTHTYAEGTWTARLTITDMNGATATTTKTIAAGNTPPTVTIDSPTCTTSCWKVGDTISFSAHASDTEDGSLPASAFAWHVGLEHCHDANDCHEHDLTDPTGVKAGSFVAPDHDSGSFLRITVTVTDSGGLQDTASIDLQPQVGQIRVVSSPAGLPVSLDGVEGAGSVGYVSEIVGHAAVVGADATVTSGEDRWAFQSWSDGGALSHSVTVGSGSRTLTATYRQTASDAPATCTAAPVQTLSSSWHAGRFGTSGDVDWIRFTVRTAGTYRLVLGDLPVNARLSLYRGCSTFLANSDNAGTHWEEMVRALPAGTYAIRMAAAAGASSATDHHWIVQRLSGTVALVDAHAVDYAASTLRFAGEVLNTSTSTRSVTVTANLYAASGKLLKRVSVQPTLPRLGHGGRSTFLIITPRPSGYARVTYTVSSTATSRATPVLSATGVTTAEPRAGKWVVTGSIRNQTSSTRTGVRAIVNTFNTRGSVLDVQLKTPSATSLAPGASAPFSATFYTLPAPPMATIVRGRAS